MSRMVYLKHGEIDKSKWDACVSGAVHSHMYGLSWYLDVICPGWAALVEGDYDAVFPLPQKRKMGLSYVYHPLFAQQLGLFSADAGKTPAGAFLDAIPRKYARVHLQLSQAGVDTVHSRMKLRRNFILPLSGPTPERRYNANTKRNLKKARASSAVVIDRADWQMCYGLKRSTAADRLEAGEWEVLKKLMRTVAGRDMSETVAVMNGSDLVSAVFFVHWSNRIYYLFSASSETGKELRASFLIVDHMVRKYTGSGKVMDFEGSMDDSLAFFFKGFGAVEELYYSYTKKMLR